MSEIVSVKESLAARKFYRTPKVVVHGMVRDLTQSGSGKSSESHAWWPPGSCKTNSIKKPCSELRVKEDIARIGDHPLGFGLYLFDYRTEYRDQWGHGRQFGVMIDEVELIMPEAVSLHADGFKRVDYAMLGIERPVH